MTSRRQHKIARVIRESVSRTILSRLSDPRITGLVSVNEVDVSPDMKNATVFISILAADEQKHQVAFDAICHAIGPIQAQLGRDLTGRHCPRLRFVQDEKTQKTLQTLRLIEQAEHEYTAHPLQRSPEAPEDCDVPDEEH
ncbi:MAG: 30S ribosome-binding factor RbfA [Planctomycetales bacterium]|nr:30S ribosome-binding factor RbfA [Planctomycetales bacterium]